jgi:hypothetical protein
MGVQIKRFNWVKRPTQWERIQAWQQHRSRMVQRFREEASAAASAFASAQQNLSVGMASLAAQASIQRAQKALSAAGSQSAGVQNQINLLA